MPKGPLRAPQHSECVMAKVLSALNWCCVVKQLVVGHTAAATTVTVTAYWHTLLVTTAAQWYYCLPVSLPTLCNRTYTASKEPYMIQYTCDEHDR
eukprot:3580-Heterococcus_DN1.PRE.2